MLHDCVIKDYSQTELIIVCSKVLSDVVREGRDRLTQAVLPVDGSFAYSEDLLDMLSNDQVQSVVASLGTGICLPGEDAEGTFNIGGLRYARIIVLSEQADLETSRAVLRFLFACCRPVVEAGCVFVLDVSSGENAIVDLVLNPSTRKLRPFDSRFIQTKLA